MPDALDNDTPAQWSAQFPPAKEGGSYPKDEQFQAIISSARELLDTGLLPVWQVYLLRQLIGGTNFHLRQPLDAVCFPPEPETK